MNYRNRGPRCPHGMLIGVIDCPGCGEARVGKNYYVRSMGGRQVQSQRCHGKARSHRTRGYSESRSRTVRG
jgi:hypothetical protein